MLMIPSSHAISRAWQSPSFLGFILARPRGSITVTLQWPCFSSNAICRTRSITWGSWSVISTWARTNVIHFLVILVARKTVGWAHWTEFCNSISSRAWGIQVHQLHTYSFISRSNRICRGIGWLWL
jgi:hypothetical protein